MQFYNDIINSHYWLKFKPHPKMKTNIFVILFLMHFLINFKNVAAQSLGFPNIATLEDIARESGVLSNGVDEDAIVYEEDDFEAPIKGKVRKADIKMMQQTHDIVSAELAAAPNDETGRRCLWYNILISWNQGIERTIASELQVDLFSILPSLMAFVERDSGDEKLASALEKVETYMVQSGDHIIRALSYHIVHEQGVVAADLLKQAVQLFGNGRLVDETSWDVDDPMPVDSAGIFILNPDLAVEELKKRPVARVRFFLTNVTDSAEFFHRYVGDGDGLEVLKAKYAANRAAIDAKHREIVAWLGAQPGQ
jgi:hypothetical protein